MLSQVDSVRMEFISWLHWEKHTLDILISKCSNEKKKISQKEYINYESKQMT